MPGGKIHSAITLATASGVIAPYALVQLNGNPYMYLLGCGIGLLVTPDLDLNEGNISDSMLRRIFPPVQWLWRTVWTPYSLLIPHRSPLSHFPILGTVLRIGYIFLIINIIYFIINLFLHHDTVSFLFLWNWSLFAGLSHVDFCHYLADISIKGKETFINE